MDTITTTYRLVAVCLAAVLGIAVLASPMSSLEARVADADRTEVALDLTVYGDIATSKFREDIAWLAATGITSGCGDGLFCPDGLVTRGQMASFLARGMALPATGVDAFSDDSGSKHHDAINRLAAAGITSGCGGDRFCPNGLVSRGQMASFLARGMALPATGVDAFSDDTGSKHQDAINRLAAAGITSGCGDGRFCPDGAVTRGQLAAFLRRGSDELQLSGDARRSPPAGDTKPTPKPTPKPSASLSPAKPQTPTSSTDPTASPTPASTPVSASPSSTPKPTSTPAPTPAPSTPSVPAASVRIGELLVSRDRLMSLPTSGAAWQALVAEANRFSGVRLSDQDDDGNVRLLAWALVTVRTGGDVGPIHAALARVPGTEAGGRTLALGRNLAAVVLAADLVGYRDPAFATWLGKVRHANLDGRTLISTHEERPNNWGTHAGASRIAAALYLGDGADLARAASVFRGWLGERSAYAGFKYGELDWQADPAKPVGINPVGARIDGRSVDGVLPEEQRRAGGFSWPPPKENYVYEALQGALLQAELLHRAGHPAYAWGNAGLARAYAWLHTQAGYPAEGDDTWQIPLVNARYGTAYPAPSPVRPGKNFGFTDWLYR